MNILTKKNYVLTVCFLLLAGYVIGQDLSSVDGFKSYLKSKESNTPKVVKFITKKTKDVENPAFSINKTNFGSFSKDIKSIGVKQVSVEEQLHGLFDFDKNYSFAQMSPITDELGFVHTNYLIYYKGYLIDEQMVMVHQKDGVITSINGIVKSLNDPIINVTVSDQQAFDTARDGIATEQLVDVFPIETVFVRLEGDEDVFRLAKKVKIFSIQPLKKYYAYIDAHTGKLLRQISLMYCGDVEGQAHTYYNGMQTITCDHNNGVYKLKDNARNIMTYNGEKWNGDEKAVPPDNLMYTNTSANWVDEAMRPALQVHWGIEKTYDYYLNVHKRKSYDNNNAPTYNIYNPVIMDVRDQAFNAAAFSGSGILIYGRGGKDASGVTYKPLVLLDIAAHEYTHIVTSRSNGGGLTYFSESGALNESFSDIFAVSVDFYTGINPNWMIGENIISDRPFIRSMSEPGSEELPVSRRQPDTYKGTYWEFTSADNGGVHINSGVQNYWFYLLCKGGTGTNDKGDNYSVTPIGIEAASKIAYRNLITYLPNSAQYIDAYFGSLSAAKDIYGEGSQEYKSVMDAWYAVGVDSLIPTPCKGNKPLYAIEKAGTFTDGSGDGVYKKNSNCSWTIKSAEDKIIQLEFVNFELEGADANGNMSDYLSVYNGLTESAPLIGKYCGKNLPPVLRSTKNAMFVTFVSDNSVHRQGFEVKYSAVMPTSINTVNTNNNIVVYPNPTKEQVFVSFKEAQGVVDIFVYDILGKIVKKVSLPQIYTNEEISLNVEDLSSGVYTLRVVGDKLNISEKIVVNK